MSFCACSRTWPTGAPTCIDRSHRSLEDALAQAGEELRGEARGLGIDGLLRHRIEHLLGFVPALLRDQRLAEVRLRQLVSGMPLEILPVLSLGIGVARTGEMPESDEQRRRRIVGPELRRGLEHEPR